MYFAVSMIRVVVVLLMVIVSAACGNEPQPLVLSEMSSSQLFEKYKKSVVLIKNRSYFKVSFEDGTNVYINSINAFHGGDITFSKDEAEENAEVNYGTGFFIGKDGLIATNFHVIAPIFSLVEKTDIKASVIETLLHARDYALEDLNWDVARLLSFYQDTAFINQALSKRIVDLLELKPVTNSEYYGSSTTYKRRIDSIAKAFMTLENIATKKFIITVETAELNITLDASTNNERSYDCKIYSLTDNSGADLALIQTIDANLPKGAELAVDLFTKDSSIYSQTILPWDTVKVTTPLSLISYNYGEEIAKTSEGIKVQLTQGNVSQESDKVRVLYSIPALPGSSGGPVFNKMGQLVAINYCGYGDKGNFNYGILSHHLVNLVKKPPQLKVVI